jgi:hypothetical protein
VRGRVEGRGDEVSGKDRMGWDGRGADPGIGFIVLIALFTTADPFISCIML